MMSEIEAVRNKIASEFINKGRPNLNKPFLKDTTKTKRKWFRTYYCICGDTLVDVFTFNLCYLMLSEDKYTAFRGYICGSGGIYKNGRDFVHHNGIFNLLSFAELDALLNVTLDVEVQMLADEYSEAHKHRFREVI